MDQIPTHSLTPPPLTRVGEFVSEFGALIEDDLGVFAVTG